MTDEAENTPTDSPQSAASDKEEVVSLGPACLVVIIVLLLIVSVGMAAGAVFLMGNQSERAAKAIEQQLIPWVEQSSLAEPDRRDIINDLQAIVFDIEQERFDERQLRRLRLRLEDSTILQWGVIQQLVARSKTMELTDVEKEALEVETSRLFDAACQGKFGMQQMEFLLQKAASKNFKSGRLTLKEDISEADIREFLARSKKQCDDLKIAEDPVRKTIPQAFRDLIEDAKAETSDGKL